MELLELLLFFAGIFIVLMFEVFYMHWLKEVRKISPVRIGRIAAIHFAGILCILRDQSNPSSIVLVILFIITIIAVWALNSHTVGSAVHGFFMTLWQIVCAAIVFYFLYLIYSFFDSSKKTPQGRNDQNK